MASPAKTWRRITSQAAAAVRGDRFEVGAAWHPFHKWRAYVGLGRNRGELFMVPAIARGVVGLFKQHGLKEWRGSAEELAGVFAMLERAAGDCELKNRQRAVPEAAAHPLAQRVE